MKSIVETKRYILREILESDVDGLFAVDSDPEVNRYLGNKPVKDKEQQLNIIKFIRQQYIDNGIGRWAIIDKNTNEFIGWTGLKWITEPINNKKHYFDLGYRLNQKHWGKGIATETALASLEYAFNSLNADKVIGIADCENAASNRILQKVGMKFVESFDLEGTLHNWYEISNPRI